MPLTSRAHSRQLRRPAASAVTAGATGDPNQVAPAENALSGTLRSLFAVANYHSCGRSGFLQLQEALTSAEDKIEYARRYYNTSARDYDDRLQTFPHNLIAGPFGFKAVAFFAADEGDRAVPRVDLANSSRPTATPALSGPPLTPGSAGLSSAANPDGPAAR